MTTTVKPWGIDPSKQFTFDSIATSTVVVGNVAISDSGNGGIQVASVAANGEIGTPAPVTGGGAGVTVYNSINDLPLSGVDAGAMALVLGSPARMYVRTDTGWFNIALINTNPSITQGPEATYVLDNTGTPTVITLQASDPEGIPITWSYQVTSGSLGNTATVSQSNNVFTITPSNNEADVGTFELTFTASDGVNLDTAVSSFTLSFVHPIGQAQFTTPGTYTWVAPTGVRRVSAMCVGAGGSGSGSGAAGVAGGAGGGGGLGWRNDIEVTPGTSYTVVVGRGGDYGIGSGRAGNSYFLDTTTVVGFGGFNATTIVANTSTGGSGGSWTGAGGGTGGKGADGGVDTASPFKGAGGGGAGGYSGNGGVGTYGGTTAFAGSGGGGGGGPGNEAGIGASIAGGGVGLLGQGANGNNTGGGGSGGTAGTSNAPGVYGGGGSGGTAGANGAVRLIWGDNRAFPNTNTTNM
jgi:hypothetical protein